MFTITPNVRCAPGISWLFYNFKEALKTAGWTIPASSDGVTYLSSGDQISGGARYGSAVFTAGSLASANAWIRLRHPLGSCELCIQHTTTNGSDSWKIRYSRFGFTGGSPSATIAPTATDEVYVIGSSTTFQDVTGSVVGAIATLNAHLIIGDADEDYAWMVVGTDVGRTNEQFVWVFDRVTNLEDAGDDPTVIGFAAASTSNPWIHTDAWTPQTSSVNQCFWTFLSTWSTQQQQMRSAAIGGMPTVVFSDPEGVHNYGANPNSKLLDLWLPEMWWFRRAIGTNIPSTVAPVTRGVLKGKSRLFKGFISTRGVWAGNSVSYSSDHYLVIFPGNNSQQTALLAPWQSGLTPGW